MHPQYTKKERKYKPMSDTILALLGFATVIAVIVLLLRNVTVPALAFVSVSTITAAILVATGAFTLDEMAGFIKEGVKGVHGTAVLFIFSVLFFGVMTDAGMFDKIIGALMKKVGNNVVGVALMTCLIAIIWTAAALPPSSSPSPPCCPSTSACTCAVRPCCSSASPQWAS